ncbi:MAG: cell division protein FtsH [Dehalococcoidales bacterium]|nr:cell division protein FtsH [Dehalococcoidales bacterium]
MFSTQQFAGQQVRPQQYQYGTVSGYYPMQTTGTDWTSMISAMMPMIMMIMMMAIMVPMMKGMTASSKS